MKQSKEIFALMRQDRLLCCELVGLSLRYRMLTSANRFQMPDMIDSETPKSAMTRTGFDGQDYELVFSDEFNTPGRTFYPGAYFYFLSWPSMSPFPIFFSFIFRHFSSLHCCRWHLPFARPWARLARLTEQGR